MQIPLSWSTTRDLTATLGLVFGLALALTVPARSATAARPDFAALSRGEQAAAVADRRWLHQHPELSLREIQTQSWLKERLGAIPGIELVSGDWGTGVVALLRGQLPGPLVAYRADIDALPITEKTGLAFASTATDTTDGRTVGVMHACGHDLHVAMLLGTARLLSNVRRQMPGSVLFVLEPGEEIGAGAQAMVQAGVFSRAGRPVAIYAMHDHPTLPVGQVGYCPGHSSANVDDFYIRVLGKGGHGAYPQKSIDPIVLSSQMILVLQTIVSRQLDPARTAVITVGSIHGGSMSNVIPGEVELRGTVRSLEPEVREQLHTALLRTINGLAQAAGAPEPEIRYVFGTPSVYNDPALVEQALPVLRADLGEANVVAYPPGMGGEDFSGFQKEIPGFIFRLGVGRDGPEMNLHAADFDPDERAVSIGIRLMSEVLWARMTRGDHSGNPTRERP